MLEAYRVLWKRVGLENICSKLNSVSRASFSRLRRGLVLEAYRVFVNDRNTPVLFVSAFTGPAILTRCELLCKLEVFCRVDRRYYIH